MSSRDRVEDTYESQNDQRLDELHSKIRTLRGVTTDIHGDVERQNFMLDETNDRFSSFAESLAQSSRRAGQAFGLGGSGAIRPWRIAVLVVGLFIALWLTYNVGYWLWNNTPSGEV
ncbi:Bet1-like protein [Schizophyllum amplum]|uniref:Bet1-like protein n=1 Tax=Schizophyllum amplum TaxID=97359 RepID=A0A550CHD3_9AGAR|nr:Bet1-like protein [Auriculariopsis ampla]